MAELERWSNAVSAEKDPEFAAGLAGSGTRAGRGTVDFLYLVFIGTLYTTFQCCGDLPYVHIP